MEAALFEARAQLRQVQDAADKSAGMLRGIAPSSCPTLSRGVWTNRRLLRAAQCSVLIISLKPSEKWEEAYERLKQEGVEAKSDLEVVLEIAF